MDFSIRRIDSGTVRGLGSSKQKKNGQHPEFDLERDDAERPAPGATPERLDDAPVAAPEDDEAGGRLDVTA
jgi:hypothetical protein